MLSVEQWNQKEQLQKAMQALSKGNANTLSAEDRLALHNILDQLLPMQDETLRYVDNVAVNAPILDVCAADVAGDGTEYLFFVTHDRVLRYVTDTACLIDRSLTDDHNSIILGLETKSDRDYGGDNVDLLFNEMGASYQLEIRVHSDELVIFTDGRRKPPFYLATRIKRFEVPTLRFTLKAIRTTTGKDQIALMRMGQAQAGQFWEAPFAIQAALQWQSAVFVAGNRPLVQRLDCDYKRGTLNTTMCWQRSLNGCVQDLTLWNEQLIVATDDNRLVALAPEDGSIVWETTLPDTPTAVTVCWRDDVAQLIVGDVRGNLFHCVQVTEEERAAIREMVAQAWEWLDASLIATDWLSFEQIATQRLHKVILQNQSAVIGQLLANDTNQANQFFDRFFCNIAETAQHIPLAELLLQWPELLSPAIWRHIRRVLGKERIPPPNEETKLLTDWLVTQHEAEQQWRHTADASPVETIHSFVHPQQAETWIIVGRRDGRVDILSAENGNPLATIPATERGPLRDVIVIDATLWLLWSNGALYRYTLSADFTTLANPVEKQLHSEAWSLCHACSNAGAEEIAVGCESGCVLPFVDVPPIAHHRRAIHLALVKQDGATTRLLTADRHEYGFSIITLATATAPERVHHVKLPGPIVELLSWPDKQGRCHPAVICANKEVYVFTEKGELFWQVSPRISTKLVYSTQQESHLPPIAKLFDVNDDRQKDLVVAIGDWVVVYDLNTLRLVECCLSHPIAHLHPFLQYSGSEKEQMLLSADPLGNIYLHKLLDYGIRSSEDKSVARTVTAVAQELERRADEVEPFTYWQSMLADGSQMLASVALTRMGELAFLGDDSAEHIAAQLLAWQLPVNASRNLQVAYFNALLRTMLKTPAGEQADALAQHIVQRLEKTDADLMPGLTALLTIVEDGSGLLGQATLPTVWQTVFNWLAVQQDPVLRRAFACIIAIKIGRHDKNSPSQPLAAYWWELTKTLTSDGDEHVYQLAQRAIGLRLRNILRKSPNSGWRLIHTVLNHRIDPSILHAMAISTAPRLLKPDSERPLFAALYHFVQTSNINSLAQLTTLLPAVGLSQEEPLVAIYHHLNQLAQITEFEQINALFVDEKWRNNFAIYLEDTLDDDPLLSAFGILIEKMLSRVASGLRQSKRDVDVNMQLTTLRALATDLEQQKDNAIAAQKYELKHGRAACAAGLNILVAILDRWSKENGVIGQRINNTRNLVTWDVTTLVKQLENGNLRVDFQLRNTGLTNAHHVQINRPMLLRGDTPVPCTLTGKPDSKIPQIAVDEKRSSTLFVTLTDEEVKQGAVQLLFTIEHTSNGRKVTEVNKTINLPSAYDAADYKVAFPEAWRTYSSEMKQWQRGQRDVMAFLDLDTTLQLSFLEGCRELFRSKHIKIVNLHDVVQLVGQRLHASNGKTSLRPVDIHRAIVEVQAEDESIPHIEGAAFRSQFENFLFQDERPVEILCFAHFDHLVRQLLKDKQGCETLAAVLTFWMSLATKKKLQIVLGGSYLVEMILRERHPEFWARVQVIRPNYLDIESTKGRQEVIQHVRNQLQQRKLLGQLSNFADPVTVPEVVDLCGGNLLFLRVFGIDALKYAKSLEDEPAYNQLVRNNQIETFFFNYGHERGFFGRTWVWLPTLEKIAYSLIANAEFPLQQQKHLTRLHWTRLNRDYYPPSRPTSSGQRSYARTAEAKRGAILTDKLSNKIRSSVHFRPDDVWLEGYATTNHPSLTQHPIKNMLLQLVETEDFTTLLEGMRGQQVLAQHKHTTYGDIYTFRIPIWRTFFESYHLLDKMTQSAEDYKPANWYPPELHLSQRSQQPHFFDKADIRPIYRELPLKSLPKLESRLAERRLREEAHYFGNFLDLKTSYDERRKQLFALIDRIGELAHHTIHPTEPERTFTPFNKLFNLKPVSETTIQGATTAQIVFGERQLCHYQYTRFGQNVLPGLDTKVLIAIVHDGDEWAAHIESLHHHLATYLEDAHKKEHENLHLEASDMPDETPIVLLIAMQGAAMLRQQLKRSLNFDNNYYVVLSLEDVAEAVTTDQHTLHIIKLCQRQIGRANLSPFVRRGPLAPGSHLFMGRKTELTHILQNIRKRPHLILGSRRIGKTTLLRQVYGQLRERADIIPLWLGITATETDFFLQMQHELRRHGFDEEATMIENGQQTGLRAVLERFRQRGKTLILLLDEIDTLYRHDKKNGELLFALLRDLTQASPMLCGLVMTGYRFVFTSQFDHDSVFFNFADPVYLQAVKREELRGLLDLLMRYGVQFYRDDEARDLILEGTYSIPYLVQSACKLLLERLDAKAEEDSEKDMIVRHDIVTVLNDQINPDLKTELFDRIIVEAEEGTEATRLRLRLQIMLFVIIAEKYSHTQETQGSYYPLSERERIFTPQDVVGYLDSWARDELAGVWSYNTREISTLLHELRMTLNVTTDDPNDRQNYYFTQDILPRLLHSYYQTQQDKSSDESLINDLDDALKQLKAV